MPTPTLQRAPNGLIYMHWTDASPIKGKPGRSRRRSTGTSDMATAQRFLGKFLLLADREQPAPSTTLTVADLWTIYDTKHVERVTAPGTLRSSWKNLAHYFGTLKVSEVTDDKAQAYERQRVAGTIGLPSKPSTVRRELLALKACFNWCAKPKHKIISKAEVPDFDVPPEADPRDRWLSHDEIQALLTTAGRTRQGERLSRAERFLWLALETGARKTAICELTWDRVDLATNVIHYNVPGRARTKKRRASVPISRALRPILDRALAERTGELVMDIDTNIWETLATVARKAGVDGVSPHVLRHTAATHMARRGVPIFKIAKILGISIATAERVYAKHCPDDLREAVDTISAGVLEAAE